MINIDEKIPVRNVLTGQAVFLQCCDEISFLEGFTVKGYGAKCKRTNYKMMFTAKVINICSFGEKNFPEKM
jgi:hypothetical protein